MKEDEFCPAARIESGEQYCKLYLRQISELPGSLWSWSVYLDGNIQHRAPGYSQNHPEPCYAILFEGEHKIVLREPEIKLTDRIESNTLCFTVDEQNKIVIVVKFQDGTPVIELARE